MKCFAWNSGPVKFRQKLDLIANSLTWNLSLIHAKSSEVIHEEDRLLTESIELITALAWTDQVSRVEIEKNLVECISGELGKR